MITVITYDRNHLVVWVKRIDFHLEEFVANPSRSSPHGSSLASELSHVEIIYFFGRSFLSFGLHREIETIPIELFERKTCRVSKLLTDFNLRVYSSV